MQVIESIMFLAKIQESRHLLPIVKGRGILFWSGPATRNHDIFYPLQMVEEPSSDQAQPPGITASSTHCKGQRNPLLVRPSHQESCHLLPIVKGRGSLFWSGPATRNHGIFYPLQRVEEPSSGEAQLPGITASSTHCKF